jgi:hypothetical protein
MVKIEKIEEAQEQTLNKVDDVHDAIYDPDHGLFARIRTAESVNREHTIIVDKKINEIESWKTSGSADDKAVMKQLQQHETAIRELEGWRVRASGFYRWVFLTFGGALVALIFKVVYELVKNHIHLV